MQGCWDSRIDPTTIPQEKWNNKRRRYTKLKADVLQQHWVCPRLKYIDCWLISIQHGMPRIIYLEGTFCFCCAVVSNDQTHPASLFFLIHTHRRAWLLLTDCINVILQSSLVALSFSCHTRSPTEIPNINMGDSSSDEDEVEYELEDFVIGDMTFSLTTIAYM